jgi:hypothetical protein
VGLDDDRVSDRDLGDRYHKRFARLVGLGMVWICEHNRKLGTARRGEGSTLGYVLLLSG